MKCNFEDCDNEGKFNITDSETLKEIKVCDECYKKTKWYIDAELELLIFCLKEEIDEQIKHHRKDGNKEAINSLKHIKEVVLQHSEDESK